MLFAKIRVSDGHVTANLRVPDEASLPPAEEGFAYIEVAAQVPGRHRWTGAGFEPVPPVVTDRDILEARYREFQRLDAMTTGERTLSPEWAAYRQALRDITQNGNAPAAMLVLFPVDPDGKDAAAHLRT